VGVSGASRLLTGGPAKGCEGRRGSGLGGGAPAGRVTATGRAFAALGQEPVRRGSRISSSSLATGRAQREPSHAQAWRRCLNLRSPSAAMILPVQLHHWRRGASLLRVQVPPLPCDGLRLEHLEWGQSQPPGWLPDLRRFATPLTAMPLARRPHALARRQSSLQRRGERQQSQVAQTTETNSDKQARSQAGGRRTRNSIQK
jgi:hypothetical protein